MRTIDPAAPRSSARVGDQAEQRRRAWWTGLGGGGLILLLTPFAAAALTDRAPDPLFTHS